MHTRRSIIALLIGLFAVHTKKARAIGAWCSPFRIEYAFAPSPTIVPWIYRLRDETVRFVDPQAQFNVESTDSAVPTSKIISDLQTGNLSLGVFDASQLSTHFSKFTALDYPGLVSAENIIRIYEGGRFFQSVQEQMNDRELRLVAIVKIPYALLTGKESMRYYRDVDGLRIATAPGIQAKVVSAFGGRPVQVPFSKTLSAWQSGQVNGAFAPLDIAEPMRFGDVARSAIVSLPYASHNVVLVASNRFLYRAPRTTVEKFLQAAKTTSLKYSDVLQSLVERESRKLRESGVTVTDYSTIEAGEDRGINVPRLWNSYTKEMGSDIFPALQALREDVSN